MAPSVDDSNSTRTWGIWTQYLVRLYDFYPPLGPSSADSCEDYSHPARYTWKAVQRFFNLLEAEGLLPEVRRLVRGLIEYKSEFDEAAEGLVLVAQRITIMGGMVPPHDAVSLLRNRKNAAVRASKTAIDQLHNTGCQLQDLETGQVDFPTLYRGQEVCLSWKLGEPNIGFWHHMDDSDGPRQAIDSEFLKNHRGED